MILRGYFYDGTDLVVRADGDMFRRLPVAVMTAHALGQLVEEQEAEIDRLQRELAEARRLIVNVADRLAAAAECLSRAAERKDKRGQP